MTDTAPPPAPPVEPPGPGQVSCDHSKYADTSRARFRPVLEPLEARDVPSVGLLGGLLYGKTLLIDPPDPIAPHTPALAYTLNSDSAAVASDGVPLTAPTRGSVAAPARFDADAADRLAGMFRVRPGLAPGKAPVVPQALGPGQGAVLRNLSGLRTEEVIPDVSFAAVAADDVALDGLLLAADTPDEVATAGTDSLIAVAGVAGSAVLLVLALRQQHPRGQSTSRTVVRIIPWRRAVIPTNKAADDPQPWPALAALLREEQEATASPDADTVTDITAQSGPTRQPPSGDELVPSQPGEVGEEGCPYIARLREFAIGSIPEASEEGQRIASHRNCPRCRRWLDFFTREADTADKK